MSIRVNWRARLAEAGVVGYVTVPASGPRGTAASRWFRHCEEVGLPYVWLRPAGGGAYVEMDLTSQRHVLTTWARQELRSVLRPHLGPRLRRGAVGNTIAFGRVPLQDAPAVARAMVEIALASFRSCEDGSARCRSCRERAGGQV